MRLSIDNRTLEIAEYIVKTHCTVRAASKKFGIAKSTIHKDITNRLPILNNNMYQEVRKVFDNNFKERHLRGGESTKRMYLMKHCHKNDNMDGSNLV